jgi:hypothetical protein
MPTKQLCGVAGVRARCGTSAEETFDDLAGFEGVVEVRREHECQLLDVFLERYVLLLCLDLNHSS